MQVLITIALIIIGVLLFEFIIFAHEFGHFITAKKSGVQVNEFALGMGPKLFSFVKGETRYSLRLFPIGGYCAMEGEDQDSDNPRAFNNAKVWKRMIIIVVGAVMNILVGFLLMLIVTAFQTEFIDTTISGFAPYAYTANAGLREGDKVVSVGGYPVANSRDLALGIQLLPCEEVDPQSVTVFKQDCCTDATNYIYTMRDELKLIDDETASTLYYQVLPPGAKQINAATSKEEAYNLFKGIIDSYYTAAKAEKPKDFAYPEIEVRDKRLRYTGDVSVIRDGEKQELKGVQFYTYKSGEDKTAVGIDFYLLPKEKNFGTVMEETFTGTVSLAKSVWKSLELLVCGRFHLTDMSGPVGITKAVSDVAAVGLQTGFGDAVLNIVMIMALITVNLGIVNMLPFPALDGGRFVFLVIEAITHRHLPRKVEYIVNGIGLALLILLIVFVSFNDIFKLFTGGFDSMT
ncbi:MAG: RIP metalloprotease RseP [Ruminococcus sp.]|nr:RIP metalloprotease RseP [Ruminococcus sp.]